MAASGIEETKNITRAARNLIFKIFLGAEKRTQEEKRGKVPKRAAMLVSAKVLFPKI